MTLVLLILHVAVCLALILIVLLQKGKGASMGAAFGGSSQTVFGSTGATPFFHKITVAAAIIFMVTSLGLATFYTKGRTSSVMEGVSVPAPVSQEAPSAPPAAPGQ